MRPEPNPFTANQGNRIEITDAAIPSVVGPSGSTYPVSMNVGIDTLIPES